MPLAREMSTKNALVGATAGRSLQANVSGPVSSSTLVSGVTLVSASVITSGAASGTPSPSLTSAEVSAAVSGELSAAASLPAFDSSPQAAKANITHASRALMNPPARVCRQRAPRPDQVG